ncbi:MAG: sigma-70 family RNA polymerase sigma factor [Candidatus Aminicenantes bacterium]|nr:sigma-70 family RNA polymerase sigma factor [Candidatus Aminicenantes bacterium]
MSAQNKNDHFESIVKNFSGLIYFHIKNFNIQSPVLDYDDISQEVILKLWKVINNEKKIKHYSSYIKKVVNSTIIDYLRKARRQKKVISTEMQERISEKRADFSKGVSQKYKLKKMIYNSVDSLIDTRKKVVKLYLLDLSIEEISILLNWTEHKTRNLLYRGLSDLKRNLKEKRIEYEDQS